VSGERSIRIAKIKHAMMKTRIGALLSPVVRDHSFWSSDAFDVVFS